MVVPLSARYFAALVGALIVIASAISVVRVVITPRPSTSRLSRELDLLVDFSFRAGLWRTTSYLKRDRVRAAQAPTLLMCQLLTWLLLFFVGYSLVLWPFVHTGITSAFSSAGSAFWTFGDATEHGAAERTILDAAALTTLIVIALQIAYLPVLYSAFNRRAAEVALLNAKAGLPAWGPELLARTHYDLGSGRSGIDSLGKLYADWERWSADVLETHTTYPPLVRVRSTEPLSSWVTAQLAVLDSAALLLAVAPSKAPTVPARMCLRSGFLCLRKIARTMGLVVSEETIPAGIRLTYRDFVRALTHLRSVDFPIERDPQEAWTDFVGWRVNYEQAAYALASATDAVPAPWSGPRSFTEKQISPVRPPL